MRIQQPFAVLGANGADEALSDGVRSRCPHRCVRRIRIRSLRKTSSSGPVYLLSRSQIRKRIAASEKRRGKVASPLGDPASLWIGRAACEADATGAMLFVEATVEGSPPKRRDSPPEGLSLLKSPPRLSTSSGTSMERLWLEYRAAGTSSHRLCLPRLGQFASPAAGDYDRVAASDSRSEDASSFRSKLLTCVER